MTKESSAGYHHQHSSNVYRHLWSPGFEFQSSHKTYSQNAETTALPLTEQITDLCDYCVSLTEAIVKNRKLSGLGNSAYISVCPQDPGPEVCRLCKVITKQMCTQEQQLATEGLNLKPVDWKKAHLWMSQTYNGGARLFGRPDSVYSLRICEFTIPESKYIVWADKGSEQFVPYLSLC